jgi:hypothetical protein
MPPRGGSPATGIWSGPMSVPRVERVPPSSSSTHTSKGQRGLTALGAVLFAVVGGLLGLILDRLLGQSLGPAFAVCFVLACPLAAALARPQDLLATVIAPPLLFFVLAAMGGDSAGMAGSPVVRAFTMGLSGIITSAPVLLLAVLASLVVAVVRTQQRRRLRSR